MIADLMPVAVIAAGTGLIVGTGILAGLRDPEADRLDLSDYHPRQPTRLVEGHRYRLRNRLPQALPGLNVPPASLPLTVPASWPPVTERCPVYVDTVIARVLSRYGDGYDDIAHRWLVEIGREVRGETVR